MKLAVEKMFWTRGASEKLSPCRFGTPAMGDPTSKKRPEAHIENSPFSGVLRNIADRDPRSFKYQ